MQRRTTARVAGGVIGVALAVALVLAGPVVAQEGDLDCGDPGTSPNMPVGPDDPNDLDRDGDGIGCEDPPEFGEATESDTAPAPEPVVAEPTFTG